MERGAVMCTRTQPAGVAYAFLLALFAVGTSTAPLAAQPQTREGSVRWSAEFPEPFEPGERASVGSYHKGPVAVNFESLSPLLIEPPPSAAWSVLTADPRRGHVVFRDEKPGLVPNPDPRAKPFYKRAEGAISALAWVDKDFLDVRVNVRVNTSGGVEGRGAHSRQGPMARWDKGSNFVWCAVNFGAGTVSIVRAQHFGVIKDIPRSERKIQGFASTKAYDVRLDAVGRTLRCQVFEEGRVVADTADVRDPVNSNRGVAGVVFELALEKTFEPLEGSFTRLSAVELVRQ
jgi:hypothetical protein